MTIATTVTKVGYTGDGVTVAFAVPFPFFNNNELEVIERVIATGAETVKTLTTHYTVAGGNGETGTVTALVAPASAVQWHIRRKTDVVQETDYPENDPFPAESHERALDRLTAIAQEQDEVIDRALKIPATDSTSINTTLPSSVDRANKYLTFDATGAPSLGTAPTVDSSGLLIVQGTDPGQAEGRFWLDTSAAPVWKWKLSKGGSWITILEANVTSSPYFMGAVLGAVAAAGVGHGLEIVDDLLRIKLDASANQGAGLLERSSNGARARLPKNYIGGLGTSRHAGDLNNDIEIKAGMCRSDDDTFDIIIPSNIIKRTDAAWTAGTNQGCMDTGTKGTSTSLAIFAIGGPSVAGDVVFSKTLSPIMPSGYTKKRRIFAHGVDGSGNNRPYTQRGDRGEIPVASRILDFDTTLVSSGGYSHAGLTTQIPTIAGLRMKAIFNVYFRRTSGTTNAMVLFGDGAIAPNLTTGPLPDAMTTSTSDVHAAEHIKYTTSNGYLPFEVTGAGGNDINAILRLSATGWIDRRGQDD